MNKYEAMIIFRPNLEEEKREEIFNKFKKIIDSNGSVSTIDEWGSRKLAYLIDDFKEGYYIVVNFESEADVVNEINRVAKITDEVIRHMVVRIEE